MATFAERLRELLDDKDMKQKDLAKLLTVQESTVSQYASVNLDRLPEARMLAKIARILGCSVDYLMGETDIRTYEQPRSADELLREKNFHVYVDGEPDEDAKQDILDYIEFRTQTKKKKK